jgi:hypothetical protein
VESGRHDLPAVAAAKRRASAWSSIHGQSRCGSSKPEKKASAIARLHDPASRTSRAAGPSGSSSRFEKAVMCAASCSQNSSSR